MFERERQRQPAFEPGESVDESSSSYGGRECHFLVYRSRSFTVPKSLYSSGISLWFRLQNSEVGFQFRSEFQN